MKVIKIKPIKPKASELAKAVIAAPESPLRRAALALLSALGDNVEEVEA